MRNTPIFRLTLTFIAITFFLLISCRKKPTSDFILNQYEYSAGDLIEYENFSVDFDSCKWEIIDGEDKVLQTFGGAHPNIVIGILSPDGTFNLRLTAYSKKQKKESHINRTFLVKTTDRNYLTINPNGYGDHDDFDVYVDNQYVGHSSSYGSFQVLIPTGMRIVKLVSGSQTFEEVYDFYNHVTIYY